MRLSVATVRWGGGGIRKRAEGRPLPCMRTHAVMLSLRCEDVAALLLVALLLLALLLVTLPLLIDCC